MSRASALFLWMLFNYYLYSDSSIPISPRSIVPDHPPPKLGGEEGATTVTNRLCNNGCLGKSPGSAFAKVLPAQLRRLLVKLSFEGLDPLILHLVEGFPFDLLRLVLLGGALLFAFKLSGFLFELWIASGSPCFASSSDLLMISSWW